MFLISIDNYTLLQVSERIWENSKPNVSINVTMQDLEYILALFIIYMKEGWRITSFSSLVSIDNYTLLLVCERIWENSKPNVSINVTIQDLKCILTLFIIYMKEGWRIIRFCSLVSINTYTLLLVCERIWENSKQNVSINVTVQDLEHILTLFIIYMKEEWI